MVKKQARAMSRVRRAAATGLGLAAVGIATQIAGGADYPPVPPGLVILSGAAVVMLVARRRWPLVVATAAAAFISVGAVVTPNLREQLGDLGEPLVFVGSGVQVAGLLVTLVFSAASLGEAFRGGQPETQIEQVKE